MLLVVLTIAADLGSPELLPGPRLFEKPAIMAVPETSVHEHYRTVSRQDDIRVSRQLSLMERVAEAERMQTAADSKLRLRILATDAGHHPAARGLVHDVHAAQAASSDFCRASSGSISSMMRGFITRATSRMTGMTTLLPNCL